MTKGTKVAPKSTKAPITKDPEGDPEVPPEDRLRETIRSAKATTPPESNGDVEVDLTSNTDTEVEGEEPSDEDLSEIEGSDLDPEVISRQIDAFLDSRFSTPPTTSTLPKPTPRSLDAPPKAPLSLDDLITKSAAGESLPPNALKEAIQTHINDTVAVAVGEISKKQNAESLQKDYANRMKDVAKEIYTKHPGLLLADSAKNDAEFNEIVEKHPIANHVHQLLKEFPTLNNSAEGLRAVVALAESRLKEDTMSDEDKEATRQTSARISAATSTSRSTGRPSFADIKPKTIRLSPAQVKVADRFGISTADYAKHAAEGTRIKRTLIGPDWYKKYRDTRPSGRPMTTT